jgi:deoxyribose-phosphate aldolase
MTTTMRQMAKRIDLTLLKPDATEDEIRKLCKEAKKYGFASVCVNPAYVSLVADVLMHTNVKVCTVIGFPLGSTTPEVKAFETKNAIENGAQEVDTVINIGALKSRNYELVKHDIKSVVNAAHARNVIAKVILETGSLVEDEVIRACKIAQETGADFVKTTTGFGPRGTKLDDIKLIRQTIGNKMRIKAAGGINTLEDAMEMIEAGADRIGSSKGVAIVRSMESSKTKY